MAEQVLRQSESGIERGGWLVILNKSLAESELHHLLSSQNYRLRGECGAECACGSS